MASTFKIALLAALPIEIVNFLVVGYPTAEHSITTINQSAAVALQWDLLHLPALIAIDRIQLLREHADACSIIFFIAGYIDTALLLAAVLAFARLSRRLIKSMSLRIGNSHP